MLYVWPYDEYYNLSKIVREDATNFTFIPIIDPELDQIRYTISKYSKGLSKYFDPHKVVKAVYSVDDIIIYAKDKKDILKKYCFRIESINLKDILPLFCRKITERYDMNQEFYLAFFIHEEDLPFTVGACKDDFYALKDILHKISFKGTTPFKYMIFKEISTSKQLHLKEKQEIAYAAALNLTHKTKRELCLELNIEESQYDDMMRNELLEIKSIKGKKVKRDHITNTLHIYENINELKFYELVNLMWKVKYGQIPN